MPRSVALTGWRRVVGQAADATLRWVLRLEARREPYGWPELERDDPDTARLLRDPKLRAEIDCIIADAKRNDPAEYERFMASLRPYRLPEPRR